MEKYKIDWKGLLLQVLIVGGFLLISFGAYYFSVVHKTGIWSGLYPIRWGVKESIWLLIGLFVPIGLFWIFLKLIPSVDSVYDPNVRMLADSFNLWVMIPYFFVNALAEELLFRGALQNWFGLLPTVVLFTLAHVSYYKRPLLLVEVFVLGIFIGVLYQQSGSLWVCTICHTFYNWVMMWLIKTDRVKYYPSNG